MAVCIACGTENRDNAMFCRGCATSMVALSGTQVASKAPAAPAVAESKGPTQECPACKARNPLVATSCKSCGASLVPDMGPAAKAVAPPKTEKRSRAPLWLAVGALLVVTAAAAGWMGWYAARPAPTLAAPVDDQPQALGVRPTPAPAPQAPLDAAPDSAPDADLTEADSVSAAAQQAERIKQQAAGVTEADRKRRQLERQQREARERAAAERQRLAREQAQRQAALERQRAEEAARQQAALAAASSAPPPAPEPVRTVDMVCAGSSNFIAREVCRSRECGNPAFVNDPVCVRFREVEAANRRQPTN